MQLYVIELLHKVKIGRSTNPSTRINSIKTGSGILENEIINIFIQKDKGKFEQKILRALNKHRINGEWFYKKGGVINFLKELKQGNEVNNEMIIRIQINSNSNVNSDALNIYKKIREERKSVGFPMSADINKIIKTRKVEYKYFIYHISADFSTFTRELKFDTSNPTSSQKIQCLRIIKNHQKSKSSRENIQCLIDDTFNKKISSINQINREIEEFFGKISVTQARQKCDTIENDLSFKFDPLQACYYSESNFEALGAKEIDIIRTKKFKLEKNYLTFDYNGRECYIHFTTPSKSILESIYN